MARVEDFVHLGRAVDWDYPTNRAITLVCGGVLVVVALFHLFAGAGLDAVWIALSAAMATFFGWAITRELDPDREYAAFLGAAFALLLVLLLPGVDLAAQFWLLLVLRLANGTPGRTPRIFDQVIVLSLTAWGAIHGHPEVGLWAALAIVVDGFGGWSLGIHLTAAALALALVPVGAALSPQIGLPFGDRPLDSLVDALLLPFAMLAEGTGATSAEQRAMGLALAVGAVLFGLRAVLLPPPISVGDGSGRRLDPRRVAAARLLVVLVVLSFAAPGAGAWLLDVAATASGRPGLSLMTPAAAACLAVSLWPVPRASTEGGTAPGDGGLAAGVVDPEDR